MNFAGLDGTLSFTGHNYDVVLDKYFAQARFYDPINKRFLADDIAKDGDNWYIYCVNNPVNYVDLTGMVIEEVESYTFRSTGDTLSIYYSNN